MNKNNEKRLIITDRKLDKDSQIGILEPVKKYFEDKIIKWSELEDGVYLSNPFDCLCHQIINQLAIQNIIQLGSTNYDIRAIIPLFAFGNAINFDATPPFNSYWWPLDKKGDENRVKFLDWMINKLKDGIDE
jgi:hypothetical protein